MQTIKFTMNFRHDMDSNSSISTEHIISSADEAREAGREAKLIVNEFVGGFSEDEDEVPLGE